MIKLKNKINHKTNDSKEKIATKRIRMRAKFKNNSSTKTKHAPHVEEENSVRDRMTW